MRGRLVRAEERARIFALHQQGMKWDAISATTGRPRNTVRDVIHAAMPKPPRKPPALRFREAVAWQGRCPAFRPQHPEDERRGRMAHHAD